MRSFHRVCHSFKDKKDIDHWFNDELIQIREEHKKEEEKKEAEEKEVERTPTRASPLKSLRSSLRSSSKRNLNLNDGNNPPLETVSEDTIRCVAGTAPEPEPEP